MSGTTLALLDNRKIGLSAFRVVLSFLVLKNMIFYFPMAEELFGPDAIFPYADYKLLMESNGVGFLTYPFANEFATKFFIALTGIVAFLFLFAIFRQISGIILFFMLFILKVRNGFILDGSDNVIEVTLPFLVFADSYSYFKYDIPLRILPNVGALMNKIAMFISRFAIVGLLIQICFVYFFTALAKLQGALWLNGTAIYYTMRVDEFRATDWNIPLTRNHYFVVLSTYFTLIWELSFAFLVWFRQTKFILLLLGVILHLGIWIFMRIDNFSWIMIGSYFVFINDSEFLEFREFARKMFSKTDQLSLLSDKNIELQNNYVFMRDSHDFFKSKNQPL